MNPILVPAVTSSHVETISLLKSSLQVLQQLIINFANNHCIPTIVSPLSTSRMNVHGTVALEKTVQKIGICVMQQQDETDNLQLLFQDIYMQTKNVFEWCSSKLDRALDQQDNSQSSRISGLCRYCSVSDREFKDCELKGDDELYGILNEYKKSNKVLKNQLKNLNKELSTYQEQILQYKRKCEEMEKQLSGKQRSFDAHNTELMERIQQSRLDLDHRDNEINCLLKTNNALQDHVREFEACIGELTTENQKLAQQLQVKNQEMIKWQQKYSQIQVDIQKKVESKLAEIPSILETKLRQKENWQNPLCQGLHQFIEHAKTQGKNADQKSVIDVRN